MALSNFATGICDTLYIELKFMVQAVTNRTNCDPARVLPDGQLVDAPLQPLTDKGNRIVGLDFLNKNIPHLIVGTVILDLVYQFVFHVDLLF